MGRGSCLRDPVLPVKSHQHWQARSRDRSMAHGAGSWENHSPAATADHPWLGQLQGQGLPWPSGSLSCACRAGGVVRPRERGPVPSLSSSPLQHLPGRLSGPYPGTQMSHHYLFLLTYEPPQLPSLNVNFLVVIEFIYYLLRRRRDSSHLLVHSCNACGWIGLTWD